MMVGRSRMLGTWENSIILRPVPLFVNYSIIVRIVREDGRWCCREIQLLWEQLLLHGLTTYRLLDHHHTFPTSHPYPTSLLFAKCLCVTVCVWMYRALPHRGCLIIILPFTPFIKKNKFPFLDYLTRAKCVRVWGRCSNNRNGNLRCFFPLGVGET